MARVERQGWNSQLTLSQDIRAKIKEAVDTVAANVVREDVTAAIDAAVAKWTRYANDRMIGAVQKVLDEKKINELIEKGVQARLEAAASLGRMGKEPRSIEIA